MCARPVAGAIGHVRHQGVTTPTLINFCEEDRRVPVSQGYELYNALLRQRVPVKMIVYPRQPHGIQEPKLIKDTMERNLEWFDKWILGRGRRQRRNESDDARFEVQGAGVQGRVPGSRFGVVHVQPGLVHVRFGFEPRTEYGASNQP